VDDFPEDLLKEFPVDESARSTTGLPIITMHAAKWDVRNALARRDETRVIRYVNLRTIKYESMWVHQNELLMDMSSHPEEVMENPENIFLVVSASDLSLRQVTIPKGNPIIIKYYHVIQQLNLTK